MSFDILESIQILYLSLVDHLRVKLSKQISKWIAGRNFMIPRSVIYCISPYSGIQTLTFLFFVTFSIHCYISFTLLWLSDDSYLSVTTFSILHTFKLRPLHICHSLPSFYIWGQCYHCTPCSLVTICNFPYFHLFAPLLPDYISPCLYFPLQPHCRPLYSFSI